MARAIGEMPRPTPLEGWHRGERQTRRRLRLVFLFVSIVVLADALVGERGLMESSRAEREYDGLATQITALRAENSVLRAEAARLKTDPEAIERLARRDLGLIRPGEIVVLVGAGASKGRRGPTTPPRKP